MEDSVIFYALLRDWRWSILAVIKETNRQVAYYDSGNRVRRTTKPPLLYRFDTESDAIVAKAKLEALERQQADEKKEMFKRHRDEIARLAASFVQAVAP